MQSRGKEEEKSKSIFNILSKEREFEKSTTKSSIK